jgi:AAA family ATP:ADP antiporter
LNGLLASTEPAQRQLAAEVLGEIGIASFYRPLLALLRDGHAAVRIAAIHAARKLRAAGTIPSLLEALPVPAFRTAAAAALVELGDVVLAHFDQAFAETHPSRESLKSIALICGRIGTAKASVFLKKQLAHPDGVVRTQVLSALVRCHEKSGSAELPEARTMIAREAAEAAWALAAWTDLESNPALSELCHALLGEIDERRQRIFLLLALIYPPAVIRKARLDLEISAGEKKAHALEVLDNLLSQDLKKAIFPLIDNLTTRERARLLHALFPQPRLGCQERLRETLTQSDGKTGVWTKACALYVVGKSRAAEWSPMAVLGFSDQDAVVRETAVWTLAHVDVSAFRGLAATGRDDPNPAVARLYQDLSQQENTHASHD